MSRAPGRKLKVFQAQFGFFDTVVAAPSQAAALHIWGTHQNLFASGQARVTTDEGATKAALQHPGVLLRRAVGSTDLFLEEPARPPQKPPAVTRKPARPPADRAPLDAAEVALKTLEDRRQSEENAFKQREQDLAAQRGTALEAYLDARDKACAAVATARKAYRKAGGKD